jgi:flavin reductase (DIM6/NTAB) family NADH-FMN oxidoreductase RutF
MNASSADVGPEVDEFALAGVTATPSTHVNVPRVKEAPASLECRFLNRISLPSTDPGSENNIVIGEVVGIHIDDAIIQDGMIDTAAYRPLARHGYMDYSTVDSVFEMLRPKV